MLQRYESRDRAAPPPADAAALGAPQAALRAACSGVCHGTLGELWQGPCEDGGELHIGLISLPVRRYSWMHFLPGENGDPARDLAGKDKCRRAIEAYLQLHGRALPPGRFRHDSELPTGKGMASSTADLVATVRCLDRVFGLRTSLDELTALLRPIERSDSVFLDRYALYLSGRQRVLREFAHAPRLHACYIDEGGTVETEKLAEPLLRHYRRHRASYRAHLDLALDAFARGDAGAVCEVATRSAQLAQWVTPKPHLDLLLRHRRELRADGLVIAHTGSLIGYLFAQRPDTAQLGEVSAFFAGLGHPCRLIETGP